MVYVREGAGKNEMRLEWVPEPVRQADHEPPPGAPLGRGLGPQLGFLMHLTLRNICKARDYLR